MRYLVTGGAGFIGYHLCKALCKNGHDVVCLDNLYTGSKENVTALANSAPHSENFTFVERDVREPLDWAVDGIFHLACPASPPAYQKDPIYTFDTAINGTFRVLERAREINARVVHASTSEVYGDPEPVEQHETYRGNVNPIGPRACYDEGKRGAECLCCDYVRQHNVDVRIARIFNTYGPHMHPYDGRVVTNFIRQVLADEPITLYGDGRQTRSFCYASDTVQALIALMDGHADLKGLPINIGNPVEFTIQQLAMLIEDIMHEGCRLGRLDTCYKPCLPDDPRKRRPNIERAMELLGWSPKVSLRDGLRSTIEWFQRIDWKSMQPNH